MTKLNEIYKCLICGNITGVMHESSGELICCNQAMNLLKENSQDAATEKHVPVIEKEGNVVTVTIGEVEHPMLSNHYIEFIEIETNHTVHRKYLKPEQKPQAIFTLQENEILQKAREYCNLHGLWKK